MKGICLLALLSFTITCFSQDRALFDKIIITYDRGGNTFGAPGISSVGEIFELVPGNETNYKFACYKKTQNSVSADGKRYLKDTLDMPFKKGRISKIRVDALFAALSKSEDNFTPEFIKPFLKTPSKARILADTIHVNKAYKFEDEEKEDLKAKFARIKSFDKIDSFINIVKRNATFEIAVVDGWDIVKIAFIKSKDTTFFNMNRMQPLGQPIREFKKTPIKDLGLYVNLEANILITEILPASSMTSKQLGIDAFTDDYIKWYIDHVL